MLSALVTSVFRVVLLITSLYLGGNSTFVRMSPPGDISANASCPSLTIVHSSSTFSTYAKAEDDADMFLAKMAALDRTLLASAGYYGGGAVYYQN